MDLTDIENNAVLTLRKYCAGMLTDVEAALLLIQCIKSIDLLLVREQRVSGSTY